MQHDMGRNHFAAKLGLMTHDLALQEGLVRTGAKLRDLDVREMEAWWKHALVGVTLNICMPLRSCVCQCTGMLVSGFSRGGRDLPKKSESRATLFDQLGHYSGGAYSGQNSGHRRISTELAEGSLAARCSSPTASHRWKDDRKQNCMSMLMPALCRGLQCIPAEPDL